jgi:PAS domain S-box-containing protein
VILSPQERQWLFQSDRQSRIAEILDKGLSAISDEEKHRISRRWITAGEQGAVDGRVFWIGSAAGLGLIALTILGAIVWTRTLRRLARQRSSQLHQELTERERAEEALKKSESFLTSIVENIPDMIFIKDAKELRFIRFNKAGEELLGHNREELLSKNDYDFFPQEQADFFTQKDREVLTSGQLYDIPEEPIDTKTGRRLLHTKKIPILDESGEPKFLLGISEDITERKLAQEKLQRSEKSLAHAQRMTHLGSWELDLVHNELTWSDEIYRIFEIDPNEFGASYEAFLDAIHPDDLERVNNTYTQSLETRQPYSIVHRLLMKDGRIKYVSERCETHYDGNGRPLRSIGTVHDITERKRNEDELRRYKDHLEDEVRQRTAELMSARDAAEAANQAKSVFLANMSHELRTPLNAILGYSSLMSSDEQMSASQRGNLDIINRNGEHLLSLINDVLEMAKIEAGGVQLEIAPFDLGGMVRDVIEMMELRCQEKGLQLRLDQSSVFPHYIKGDMARLRQILLNLLSNAVKFTERGSVTVRLGVRDDQQQHLVVEVEDTGQGISPEDQKRLFKPFVQLNEGTVSQGTGLGLTITRQFVQMMGGEIDIESEYGRGSLFRVVLPIVSASEADVLNNQTKRAGEVIGLAPKQPVFRILIAEDQQDNQLLLNRLMTNVGFSTRLVANGEACVKAFQQWHPHLIWMDWRMPVMDGVEACREIRRLPGGGRVKIIAVTASAFKEEREEAIGASMDDLVRKPYRPDELYDCMARHLGLKFLYAEKERAETADLALPLTPTMLEVIPPTLRQQLHGALERLDSEQITAIIKDIAINQSKLALTLDQLASNFDYPAILQALEAVRDD